MAKTVTPRENLLLKQIQSDTKLSEDVRIEYLNLARAYLEDFVKNLTKTSIELDDVHPFGMDTWQEFLNYPPVRKYTETYRKEVMNKRVDEGLMIGDKDAISIKKELERNGDVKGYSNFIVFCMPERNNQYDLTGEI